MTLILPDWVDEVRPHQEQAVIEIVDAYEAGAQVVVLDAPTGSGKTLIADMVRQMLGADTTNYVCSDKSLQAQFTRDFPESKLLMGKANYVPDRIDHLGKDVHLTCDDCTGNACRYCHSRLGCPYVVARSAAFEAPVAVLNTAYYLREVNGPGRFKDRDFTIFDECDTLESYVMGWAEVRIRSGLLRDLHVKPPLSRGHWTTLILWLRTEFLPALQSEISTEADPKVAQRLKYLYASVRSALASHAAGEHWVKKVDEAVVLKPVKVDGFGQRGIWRHFGPSQRALLMSGSVISPSVLLDELGYTGAFDVVRVPSTFPVANRPIYNIPVAPITRKSTDAEVDRLLHAIHSLVNRHPTDAMLIHTVSYDLTRKVVNVLQRGLKPKRDVWTYYRAIDRDRAIENFKAHPGSVLVAPSLARGVDLPDELCRVQVVAKVPAPNLGDRLVSERLDAPGGESWYAVQTVRSIVQMSGRAIRSDADHATTYILDSMFTRLLSRHGHMFPDWWKAAISTPFQPSDLTNTH